MTWEMIGTDRFAARAAADLSARQYHAVVVNSNGEIVLAAAGQGLGILIDDPVQGEFGTVQVAGVAKWAAGAAFNAGAKLSADANGRAVVATELTVETTGGTVNGGTNVLAIALAAASTAGEIVPVLLVHAGFMRA